MTASLVFEETASSFVLAAVGQVVASSFVAVVVVE